MKHSQSKENQQNCPLKHKDVLNISSGNDERALGKHISFGQLLYVVLYENTYKSSFHSLLPQIIKILLKLA